MNLEGIAAQLAAMLLALVGAPLLTGWVNQCRAWLQNRTAPPLLQPFRMLHKLFWKDAVIARDATPIYRLSPYIVFGCMLLASMIIPTVSTNLPLAPAADAIALVGLFALARLFISLAAMDIGTSFGTLGARREMLIGFLAEPAFLMVLFTTSLISNSTSLATIVSSLGQRELSILPSLAFAGVAFTMVSLAENARVPVDNPATHLELTMIHEAMVLEYSGARRCSNGRPRSSSSLFVPGSRSSSVGHRAGDDRALLRAWAVLAGKLAIGGFLLALIETMSAEMRIFRVPEFLATAFLLGVLALLVHLLLGA